MKRPFGEKQGLTQWFTQQTWVCLENSYALQCGTGALAGHYHKERGRIRPR